MRLIEAADLQATHHEIDQVEASTQIVVDSINDSDYSFRVEKVVTSIKQLRARMVLPELDDLLAVIDVDINAAIDKFHHPDYYKQLIYRNPQGIREFRKLHLPTGIDAYVLQAIDTYINWQYPGLEIGCRDGEWTSRLVGCDPLYITDLHQEFIDSTVGQYSKEYQRRLRPYLITDGNFSALPQGQFGFIFSWNYFNYLTLEQAREYLKQCWELMRPGGAMMFSYNNADLPAAAGQADSYYMSWMPKSLLVPICEQLGFVVISSTDFDPVSWIELKKPGELKLIKAHQVLGEIKFVNPWFF